MNGIPQHVFPTAFFLLSFNSSLSGLESGKTHGAWLQDLMKLMF